MDFISLDRTEDTESERKKERRRKQKREREIVWEGGEGARRTERLSIRKNRNTRDRFVRLIRARSHKMTLVRSSARHAVPAPLVLSRAREATPENYCSPYIFVRTAELGPSRIKSCPLDTIGKVTIHGEDEENETVRLIFLRKLVKLTV